MIDRASRSSVAACRLLILSAIGVSLAGSCSRAELGLPRVAVSAVSPDGHYRAFVRNHPSIDPPAQSLWLSSDVRGTKQVRKLSEDQDWCRVIAWAGDSRSVAFLVQDARLIVVDAVTGRGRADRWLIPQDGYPPTQVVTDLALSRDGTSVRFKACRRTTDACTDRTEPVAQE